MKNIMDLISNVITANDIKNINIPSSGIYFWFAKEYQLQQLNITPIEKLSFVTINNEKYFLIYIGIAPENERSKTQLKTRVMQNHMDGNISSSTFRYAIASLLKIQFYCTGEGKNKSYKINNEDDLTDFIKTLQVGFFHHEQPWEIEKDLILSFEPPINIEHNKKGWFCKSMRGTRKTSRDTSK